MRGYTLVTVDADSHRDAYEALYSRGRLIAQSEGGPFTAATVLEALALDTVAVQMEYVSITKDYDSEVLAERGWPEDLDSIPQGVRT